MKGALFIFALWGVLFALVPFAVDFATRKEFIVHSSGAIIVTGTFFNDGDKEKERETSLTRESPLTSRSIHPSFILASTNHSQSPIFVGINRKDKTV
jgi:hypothetical protein